jgi:Ca2+/Na+ antiporter
VNRNLFFVILAIVLFILAGVVGADLLAPDNAKDAQHLMLGLGFSGLAAFAAGHLP